eukprot:30592_1
MFINKKFIVLAAIIFIQIYYLFSQRHIQLLINDNQYGKYDEQVDAAYANKFKNRDADIFKHYILFLRMFHGSKNLFYRDFFETFKFFWPFAYMQANLLIVLDDESDLDHQFEMELRETFNSQLSSEIADNSFNYYITYEKPNGTIYNYKGWNRQQWSMFWCDKFLHKLNISNQFKYIGFVDTDTAFTSIITPQTIFADPSNIYNPKPIIIASIGFTTNWFPAVGENTPKWFGKTELFQHMVQFPATFSVSHVQHFRDTTIKYWFKDLHKNHGFDEVVQEILKQPGKGRHGKRGTDFAQFNLFSTYAWYFAQNEYEWYFEPHSTWNKRKKMYNITGSYEEIYNLSILNTHDGYKESMVRIAIHEKYAFHTTTTQLIAKGYCFSINWKDSPFCTNLNNILNLKNGFYSELFIFDTLEHIWSTDLRFRNQSFTAQLQYYQNVRHVLSIGHHWHRPTIPCKHCSNMNFSDITALEYMNLTILQNCKC